MAGKINTAKLLNNNYFSADNSEGFSSSRITISPDACGLFEEDYGDDAVLAADRKDTAEKIYKIWQESPWSKEYGVDAWGIKKIPKKDIFEIFYYVKEKLEKQKEVTAFELVIAINEFFDFSYEFVCQNILSPKLQAEIYEDYYNNMGKKAAIDEMSATPLF